MELEEYSTATKIDAAAFILYGMETCVVAKSEHQLDLDPVLLEGHVHQVLVAMQPDDVKPASSSTRYTFPFTPTCFDVCFANRHSTCPRNEPTPQRPHTHTTTSPLQSSLVTWEHLLFHPPSPLLRKWSYE